MVRLGVGDLLGHQCNYSFYLQTSRVSSRCSTPGTDKVGKCPAVAGGGGDCPQLELTDALRVQIKYTVRGQGIMTYNRNWREGVWGGGRSNLP